MNAKSAVFSYVAIRPSRIRDLVLKLPYAKDTIYRAIEMLVINGRLVKGKDGTLMVSPYYDSQKQREVYMKALSYGIDPEILMRKSTLAVWSAMRDESTLSEIRLETNLSKKWISRLLSFLETARLIIFIKRKPIKAVINQEHELTAILDGIVRENEEPDILFISESAPYEERLLDRVNLEKALFEKIDDGLAVKNTGFLVKGERFTIFENVDQEMGFEELFLRKLGMQKGVESDCIQLIAQKKMNYHNLMHLAMKKSMLVNIVGCYLDIINGIRPLIDPDIIVKFHREINELPKKSRRSRPIFLKEEKLYGKTGWESKYEEKWNVDLYLDIGAIRHGVRAV